MRKFTPQTGSYYHVYNRGVDKRRVFCDGKDYQRFLTNLTGLNNNLTNNERDYIKRKNLASPADCLRQTSASPADCLYKQSAGEADEASKNSYRQSESEVVLRNEQLVEIICYCLLPNHYHLLLKENRENGLSKFIQKIGTGYTQYFNRRYKRSGYLFQSKYKSEPVKTDSYLLSLSCYIHGNPEIHGIDDYTYWHWSSYKEYVNPDSGICKTDVILDFFSNFKEYEKLIKSGIIESRLKKYGRKKTTNKRLS